MDEIIDYVMETPGNTNPNVLRGMLNNSGGNLPPVTSDDNGDVLTVVDGKWAKATPSGGGGALVCTMDDATGTLSHTWQEIHDAAPFAWLLTQGTYKPLFAEGIYGQIYGITFLDLFPETGVLAFAASSADGYPVYSSKE